MMLLHFMLGATVVLGVVLAVLLLRGLDNPQHRVWPAPPSASWASSTYWWLFRATNVAVLAINALCLYQQFMAETLTPLQLLLMLAATLAFALYGYTLFFLGKSATYCEASGLKHQGVYNWSRNPQYAAAILAYGILGLAGGVYSGLLASLIMAAVYALMATAEEPWLQAHYGKSYEQYAQAVPRFFNWRQLVVLIRRKAKANRANHLVVGSE